MRAGRAGRGDRRGSDRRAGARRSSTKAATVCRKGRRGARQHHPLAADTLEGATGLQPTAFSCYRDRRSCCTPHPGGEGCVHLVPRPRRRCAGAAATASGSVDLGRGGWRPHSGPQEGCTGRGAGQVYGGVALGGGPDVLPEAGTPKMVVFHLCRSAAVVEPGRRDGTSHSSAMRGSGSLRGWRAASAGAGRVWSGRCRGDAYGTSDRARSLKRPVALGAGRSSRVLPARGSRVQDPRWMSCRTVTRSSVRASSTGQGVSR